MKTIANAHINNSYIEFISEDDTEWVSYESPEETRRETVRLLNSGYEVLTATEHFVCLIKDTNKTVSKLG